MQFTFLNLINLVFFQEEYLKIFSSELLKSSLNMEFSPWIKCIFAEFCKQFLSFEAKTLLNAVSSLETPIFMRFSSADN